MRENVHGNEILVMSLHDRASQLLLTSKREFRLGCSSQVQDPVHVAKGVAAGKQCMSSGCLRLPKLVHTADIDNDLLVNNSRAAAARTPALEPAPNSTMANNGSI